MYATKNYRTKKELKEAVADPNTVVRVKPEFIGPTPTEGTVFLEGPWDVHNWYAECTMRNGQVVHVK